MHVENINIIPTFSYNMQRETQTGGEIMGGWVPCPPRARRDAPRSRRNVATAGSRRFSRIAIRSRLTNDSETIRIQKTMKATPRALRDGERAACTFAGAETMNVLPSKETTGGTGGAGGGSGALLD